MKKRKMLLGSASLVLSAVMTFTLLPGGAITTRANDAGDTFTNVIKTHADIFDGKADQYKGKTIILHSNDVHGAIDGYAKIAELEDDFEEAGAEVSGLSSHFSCTFYLLLRYYFFSV